MSILSLVFSFSGGESEPAYSAKFDFETMELVAILFSEYPSVIWHMERIIKKGNKAENAIIAIAFRLEKQKLSFVDFLQDP